MDRYEIKGTIDEAHGVHLVRRTSDGCLCALKCTTLYHKAVFEYLRLHPVPFMPRILELEEENGALYVLEEYIAGKTLEKMLEEGRCFSEAEALRLTRKLCEIVKVLHGAEPPIVHRDIKPSNIILNGREELYLLDLDAARYDAGPEAHDTELIGTPGYAAPEQYGFGSSSPAADIYAVGVVLNELLTGALPRDRMAEGEAGRIVRKAIQMNPGERYAQIGRMIEDLLYAESISEGQKSGRFRRFMALYGLPGQRRLTWWKLLISLPYYGFLIMMILLCDFGYFYFLNVLYGLVVFSFPLIFPLYWFNYRGLRKKITFGMPYSPRIGRRIGVSLLLAAASFLLMCVFFLLF